MPDIEYVKDYREKELRQYVMAYLLIAIASVGFHTVAGLQQISDSATSTMVSILQMIMTDIFLGAICVIVVIFNEVWPDSVKTKLIYRKMPSDTVFSRIATSKIDPTGIDLDRARAIYAQLASAPPAKQTSEWNILLRKCREAGRSNVVDAQRMQLMTRDLCLSTFSLLIMNIVAIVALAIVNNSICTSLKMLGLPISYLIVMLIVTMAAARNRAHRLVAIVIKNDVQDNKDNQTLNE